MNTLTGPSTQTRLRHTPRMCVPRVVRVGFAVPRRTPIAWVYGIADGRPDDSGGTRRA